MQEGIVVEALLQLDDRVWNPADANDDDADEAAVAAGEPMMDPAVDVPIKPLPVVRIEPALLQPISPTALSRPWVAAGGIATPPNPDSKKLLVSDRQNPFEEDAMDDDGPIAPNEFHDRVGVPRDRLGGVSSAIPPGRK